MNLICVEKIYKSYIKTNILNDISLDIMENDMIAIMGRSGSGKTTLLNILGFLDTPDKGLYKFKNENIDYLNESIKTKFRRNFIGFITQNYALIYDKPVFYNIAISLLCNKVDGNKIKFIVNDISKKLNINGLLEKFPYQLSGGECQRVAIARAIVKNPSIIIADEPTGALDEKTEDDILSLFQELNKRGSTILIATHNNKVAYTCNKIIKISDGRIYES